MLRLARLPDIHPAPSACLTVPHPPIPLPPLGSCRLSGPNAQPSFPNQPTKPSKGIGKHRQALTGSSCLGADPPDPPHGGGAGGHEGEGCGPMRGAPGTDLLPPTDRIGPCLGSFPRCDVTPARRIGGRVQSKRRTASPHPSLAPDSPGTKMAAAPPPNPRTDTAG